MVSLKCAKSYAAQTNLFNVKETLHTHFTPPTCLLSAWRGSSPSLEAEVVDFAGSAAGFGASSEVGKGEALVLRQCGEAEVLGAEEEQGVEQHYGGVGAQLLTLPQVGLHDTRGHDATLRRKGEAGKELLHCILL